MKKLLLLLSFCFLFVISGRAELKTYTEDCTVNPFVDFPTSAPLADFTGYTGESKTNTGLIYTLYGSYRCNFNTSGFVILGKRDAYMVFPTFSNGVITEIRITLSANSSAANSSLLEVNSDNNETELVSLTMTKGGINKYTIASKNQGKDKKYKFKITSAHNVQITKIEIDVEETTAPATQVATPTITPAFGDIVIGETITVDCQTKDAVLNGKIGNNVSITNKSFPYTYKVQESDLDTTLDCVFEASKGDLTSSKLEGTYTVVAPAAEKPTFSLKDYDEVYVVDGEGNITNEKVVITGTAGCSLSLTVNGTEVETVAASDAVPTIEYTFSGDPCEKFTLVAKTTNKYNGAEKTTAHYIIASTSKLMGELTVNKTNVTNSYQAFDPAVIAGGVFAGFAFKNSGFQMNSTNTQCEIVMTYSIGEIQAIEITFAVNDGRTLSVYGKNEPYAVGGGQLNESATQGDLLTTFITTKGKTVSYNIPWDYKYIGLKITDGGAASVSSLKVIWRTGVDGLDVSYDKVTEASLVSGKFSVLAAMNGSNTTFARNEGVATVELGDDGNISLLKGQITVDEFEINGNQDSFTLCGGLGVIGAENNTRTYLAVDADNNVIRVQDEASAANFKLELENGQVLVKFDGGEYLAYNGTNFVKTATIGEGYTAVNIFVNGSGVSTGVEAVEIEDADAPVEYYNLQGVRVANPQNGLYIVRQGNKVSKQIIR